MNEDIEHGRMDEMTMSEVLSINFDGVDGMHDDISPMLSILAFEFSNLSSSLSKHQMKTNPFTNLGKLVHQIRGILIFLLVIKSKRA